jgi:hypothetical protein
MKRTLLKSAKLRSATIVVMQKLARTLSAAEKPRRLIHHMPVLSHFDDQFRGLFAAVDAIAG